MPSIAINLSEPFAIQYRLGVWKSWLDYQQNLVKDCSDQKSIPGEYDSSPPRGSIRWTLLDGIPIPLDSSGIHKMSVDILGLGTAFPETLITPEAFEPFLRKHGPQNSALEKTIKINHRTQILTRTMVVNPADAPFLNEKTPPTIEELNDIFMEKGVALAVNAAKGAIQDWGGRTEDITHLVCVTCTAAGNPGYDLLVSKSLRLPVSVDRVLLHGVGCAGGLAGLRLARQLASVPSDKPLRVLVIATEVTSTLCRVQIEQLAADPLNGDVALTLFSDGASAMIVGRDPRPGIENSSFRIMHGITQVIPDSDTALQYNVHSNGWKAVISPALPELTSKAVPGAYQCLVSSCLVAPFIVDPDSLDWLVHPGGAGILTGIEQTMGISRDDHTRSSWEVYRNKGNLSSASIGVVIEDSRNRGGREFCVAVAFGPGVQVEMFMLQRIPRRGEIQLV